jgi:DnaJ family protein A protein 2
MPRKAKGPKRNIWTDPSPYGTYEGNPGTADDWKAAFNFAFFTREKALGILIHVQETPFQILGVREGASQEEIQSAFRKLALIHHPDKGGDREMFDKVMSAYTILKEDM